MAIARPIRLLGALGILGVLLVLYRVSQSTQISSSSWGDGKLTHDMKRDPLLDREFLSINFATTCRRERLIPISLSIATGEPEGILWRAEDHDYSPNSENSARINATLLSLVRNEELGDLVMTMKDLERTWNHKFNYPWTFLNDKPFTEEFKRKTQEVTKAKCIYGMCNFLSQLQKLVLS